MMEWAQSLPGRPFCYRIRASPACCPPCHRGGACEGTGGSRPPLPVWVEYLCSETLVPGKPERPGTGLSRGLHPPDTSGLETDDLQAEEMSIFLGNGCSVRIIYNLKQGNNKPAHLGQFIQIKKLKINIQCGLHRLL